MVLVPHRSSLVELATGHLAALAAADDGRYACLTAAFARRPLGAGVGMHSYVSFKRDAGKPNLTVASEAYCTLAPGSLAKRTLLHAPAALAG